MFRCLAPQFASSIGMEGALQSAPGWTAPRDIRRRQVLPFGLFFQIDAQVDGSFLRYQRRRRTDVKVDLQIPYSAERVSPLDRSRGARKHCIWLRRGQVATRCSHLGCGTESNLR